MVKNIDENIQIVTWHEARNDIIKVNPSLVKIIDSLSPNNKYRLIKAKYRYGDMIVDQGQLQLPGADGQPSTSLAAHSSLASLLNYSAIPLAILLNRTSDIFLMDEDYIVPQKVFKPGDIFGTFEVLNYLTSHPSLNRWCVSAGSRLIFTLPRISEANSFKKLRLSYNLEADPPRTLTQHWDVFKQIARHKDFNQAWTSDVIFFTEDWFDPSRINDKAWQGFQLFLFRQGWLQGKSIFEKEELDFFWRALIKAMAQRRLNTSLYLVNTLKHLLLASIGEAPVFQPLVTDLAAPYQGIQNVLLSTYELKNYFPTLMHLTLSTPVLPLYYSLAFPIILEGSSEKNFRPSTLMTDLKDLKLMIETITRNIDIVKNGFLENKKFDFFHIQEEKPEGIKPSRLLPIEDDRFIAASDPNLSFCATSPFWRGCIRISS